MSLGLLLPILVGISLGLFGGGGSILSVAILSFALGMPPKAAIAASLLVTAVSSSAAWLAQRGSRLGSVRTGIAFGGAGMVGAFAGGRLASLVTLGSVVGSVVAKRAPPVALRRGFMVSRIRADFDERVVVHPGAESWALSPTAGVERKMLDRIGDEVARATSIVRFAPNTVFPEHVHGGGEEFFVLQGLFVDDDGEYPVGAYVRNPVGSKHAPRAGADGATLLVKLYQFSAGDRHRVVVQTASTAWQSGSVLGLSVLPLHEFGEEHVALVRWAPNTQFHRHSHWGGEEVLVLDGVFRDEHGEYPSGSWIRSPHLSTHLPFTTSEGATIFVKTGHLLP